jgi:hypothetical protein
MAVSFKIYGTIDTTPNFDEITELLEESDFDITIELDGEDEDEDAEDWGELFIYEASLDEPISLYRISEEDDLEEELEHVLKHFGGNGHGDEIKDLRHTLDNCVVIYGVEVPEECEDDDTALVLASLIVQTMAQRCDGIYCVDGEGFFNDAGDLIYELAEED